MTYTIFFIQLPLTQTQDGFDVLYKRTEGSLKVSNDMATFFKKLAIIEADHAKLLVKLSANYGTKKLLANPHIDGYFSISFSLHALF